MNMTTMTLEQVRAKGLKALAEELGPVGMVRFLQQTETGHGDYSRERQSRVGKQNVASLAKRIETRRKNASS
jgi:hypothetical protein